MFFKSVKVIYFFYYDFFQKWNGASGTNLHGVQYRILKRALELLEVDGRLVYSTCSLNPVEDEAVIQRMILDAGKENVVIEEASEMVPGIYRFFS